MKVLNYLLIGFFTLAAFAADAQYLMKNSVGLDFMELGLHQGLRTEIDLHRSDSTTFWRLAPVVYYRFSTIYKDLEPDIERIVGGGLSFGFYKYVRNYGERGAGYIGVELSYRYLDVSFLAPAWREELRDGSTVLISSMETVHQKSHGFRLLATAGRKRVVYKRFTVDAQLSYGYQYSFVVRDAYQVEDKYNTSFADPAYTGMIIRVGFVFGRMGI